MSILVTAIRSGNLEVVKEKFSRPGSQVNTPIQHGRSPLHIAVQAQKLDVMKYLLGKGADVNLADEDECSPLYYAVLNENRNLVEYLLQMDSTVQVEIERISHYATVAHTTIKKYLYLSSHGRRPHLKNIGQIEVSTARTKPSEGADPDGEDPEGNKLMDTVKDDKIKSMLKNA